MFLARDYLVVEVALFPVKDQPVVVQANQFHLRVNGKKDQVLSPVAPEFVASSLHPTDFSRIPDDQLNGGMPTRPQWPTNGPSHRTSAGTDKGEVQPEAVLTQTALAEGEH